MKIVSVTVPMLIILTLQASPQSNTTSNRVVADSESAACDILKRHVAELYLENKRPDRYWFCDFSTIRNDYVRIVGLGPVRPATMAQPYTATCWVGMRLPDEAS